MGREKCSPRDRARKPLEFESKFSCCNESRAFERDASATRVLRNVVDSLRLCRIMVFSSTKRYESKSKRFVVNGRRYVHATFSARTDQRSNQGNFPVFHRFRRDIRHSPTTSESHLVPWSRVPAFLVLSNCSLLHAIPLFNSRPTSRVLRSPGSRLWTNEMPAFPGHRGIALIKHATRVSRFAWLCYHRTEGTSNAHYSNKRRDRFRVWGETLDRYAMDIYAIPCFCKCN